MVETLASPLIYFMAGLFWLYCGTLKQLIENLAQVRRR